MAGFDPLDRSRWDEDQQSLIRRRQQIHTDIAQGAYEAGRVRGSRGDYEPPPWMAHLHEIAPTMENPGQFAAAHKYGQVEAYVDHAHDLIQDEFTPRAQAIAKEAGRATTAAASADTTFRSRAMVAAAGRSRYPIAPTMRRNRLAHARVAEVQGRANALQSELDDRLGEVDKMRQSLHYSPWKPQT